MERLPHGYTNRTRRLPNGCIEKVYKGPRRWENARRELTCLTALAERLPVPVVVDRDLARPAVTMTALPGNHGQDLVAAGHAARVLSLIGTTLVRLHALAPASVPGLAGGGPVVVHGDFGPQNMLFDLDTNTVCGVVDWESAHLGSRIEDLAWTEWIVRMHHPDAIDALNDLFASAHQQPPWTERHAAMLEQIRGILAYCETSGMESSSADWRDRLTTSESWYE